MKLGQKSTTLFEIIHFPSQLYRKPKLDSIVHPNFWRLFIINRLKASRWRWFSTHTNTAKCMSSSKLVNSFQISDAVGEAPIHSRTHPVVLLNEKQIVLTTDSKNVVINSRPLTTGVVVLFSHFFTDIPICALWRIYSWVLRMNCICFGIPGISSMLVNTCISLGRVCSSA